MSKYIAGLYIDGKPYNLSTNFSWLEILLYMDSPKRREEVAEARVFGPRSKHSALANPFTTLAKFKDKETAIKMVRALSFLYTKANVVRVYVKQLSTPDQRPVNYLSNTRTVYEQSYRREEQEHLLRVAGTISELYANKDTGDWLDQDGPELTNPLALPRAMQTQSAAEATTFTRNKLFGGILSSTDGVPAIITIEDQE